jgi:hypothetical protein
MPLKSSLPSSTIHQSVKAFKWPSINRLALLLV